MGIDFRFFPLCVSKSSSLIFIYFFLLFLSCLLLLNRRFKNAYQPIATSHYAVLRNFGYDIPEFEKKRNSMFYPCVRLLFLTYAHVIHLYECL